MLLGWAVLAFAVIINTVGSKTLAHFEGLILILYILGFFAILIPLAIYRIITMLRFLLPS